MIVTEQIDYHCGDAVYRGFIAYDKSIATKLPGVLISHDWGGRGEFVCDKAIKLASMGYLGFALDMYGDAKIGQTKAEKQALLTPLFENRQELLARITAAFHCLSQLPNVDKNKIAAMGYCFGGLCVLDLARSAANVNGTISFHGLLSAPEGAKNKEIKSKILVLHGYDDPLVKPDQVKQFADEMNERKADWQVHMYGGVQHSFTNPEANDNEMGLHYNALADKRSWESATAFLKEVLGSANEPRIS